MPEIDPVLIDVPMPVRTPRLLLRPPQAGDGPALHEAKHASLPALRKWLTWAKYIDENADHTDDEIMCRKKSAAFLLREDLMTFAFSKDDPTRLIGSSGLHRFSWKKRQFEIGYWVRSDETGKGYATEICAALCHYAFRYLAATKITIIYSEGNDASRKVIEKVGFEKEGVLRKSDELPDGRLVDKHIYGMLTPDNLPDIAIQAG